MKNFIFLLLLFDVRGERDDFRFCGNRFKMDIVYMVDTGHGDREALRNQQKMIKKLVDWIPGSNSRRNFHQQKIFPFHYRQSLSEKRGFSRGSKNLKGLIDRVQLIPGGSIPVSSMTDQKLNLFERAFYGSKPG